VNGHATQRAFNRGTIGGLGFGMAIAGLTCMYFEGWKAGCGFAAVGMVVMHISTYVLRPSWTKDTDKERAP
jgi:hypothetical protein